ncbi:MAG: glycoside hydrolase family 97 catalytic domain-containing protein [Kiritimatiellia bacterium]
MKTTLLTCSLCISFAALAAGPSLELRGLALNGTTSTAVERRSFADGEAVRYTLPEGKRHISGEETVWTLPEDATAWYSLEDPCYEGLWHETVVREIPVGTKIGLPITAKLKDGTYRFVTEANVVDYTDSSVVYQGEGRFAVRYYADEKGFDQEGVAHTPWRVLGSFKDLDALATSDIVRRLCPEPTPEVAARAASFVKPGRCIWHWLPDGAPKFHEQKGWYDRTKAMGYEYYLVDEGWRGWRAEGRDQWSMLEEVVAYGNSIGVKSFVWVHSRELMNPEARRAYLSRVKALGAVGIKIDFMPPPSYRVMKWYEETSRDTLEVGLMLDYHGAVKPTGREKTWPHEVAREAIRGHEWHITRYDRVLPPAHDTILPFTRLVQGHADYTPVVFNPCELVGYTWAHELAQGIVFSAPFLCFGDYPENYLKSAAVDLMRELPSVYDETRVLPGSDIGQCVALAKRAGDDWYVAIENGANPRQLKIALGFLGAGDYELLSFGDKRGGHSDDWRKETRAVTAKDTLDVRMKPLGGYVARLRRK